MNKSDMMRLAAIGNVLQTGGQAGLVSLGRILKGCSTVQDRAEWPGLAHDMACFRDGKPAAPYTTVTTLFVMEWDEYESGWGIRPDGYSVNLSKADYDTRLAEHTASQSRDSKGMLVGDFEISSSANPRAYVVPSDLKIIEECKGGRWRFDFNEPSMLELRKHIDKQG